MFGLGLGLAEGSDSEMQHYADKSVLALRKEALHGLLRVCQEACFQKLSVPALIDGLGQADTGRQTCGLRYLRVLPSTNVCCLACGRHTSGPPFGGHALMGIFMTFVLVVHCTTERHLISYHFIPTRYQIVPFWAVKMTSRLVDGKSCRRMLNNDFPTIKILERSRDEGILCATFQLWLWPVRFVETRRHRRSNRERLQLHQGLHPEKEWTVELRVSFHDASGSYTYKFETLGTHQQTCGRWPPGHKDSCRDPQALPHFDSEVQDLRAALRMGL